MRMASMVLRIGSVLLGLEVNAAQVQAGEWPGGRQVAVVLTYDDAGSIGGIELPASP
jgi:hypothetical protein